MPLVLAGFALTAIVVSFIATAAAVRIGNRMNALDTAGREGQVKGVIRRIPNTGGVGVFTAIVATLSAASIVVVVSEADPLSINGWFPELAAGVVENMKLLWLFLAGLTAVHVMGVLDDRRPLHWAPKLVVMLAVPAMLAAFTDTRVLTMLDEPLGGVWASVTVTALWFAVVMNAMNFLDNMDGLAGGLGAVVSAALLAIAALNGQWLIAAGAATLLGASVGFLPHNFPRARVFLGDGGSLVIGFVIAFLTARLTYDATEGGQRWHLLAVPLVLLAVPLYDFASVVLIRLAQGKSPFVGDLQHFSHRMDRRGLGKTGAVVSIWVLAAVTGLGAVVMSRSVPWQAAVIAGQTLCVLGLIAYLERGVPERPA